MTDTDLQRAFQAIAKKRPSLDLAFTYYNGPQPLRYSTERLKEAFDDIKAHFEINWCSVVTDATLDRIVLSGFDTPDQAANDLLAGIFDAAHLDIEADKAHCAALVATEGYLIAWRDGAEYEIYYNDPRMCHCFYSSTKPRLKTYAAKWFVLDDGRQEMTLYYTDRIEHWQTEKPMSMVERPESFRLVGTDPNQFGVIPVFELRSPGEFAKVTSLQDAVNKLFADMMVAAEFGAFVQRWVISQSDVGQLKNGPNMIWWLPAGDESGQPTSTGQFTPTALDGYLSGMDKIANSMAIITRTPKHYFMTTGANVSGEALMAMESPLVKKVKTRQRDFAAVWQDVAVFLLQLAGVAMRPEDVTVIWERPESIQPFTEAQIRQLAINSGIPLKTQLKREGWTDAELQSLEDDGDGAGDVGTALARAMREMDETAADTEDDTPPA